MEPVQNINLKDFETGTPKEKDGVTQRAMHSFKTGFIYVKHELSETMLDEVYENLNNFFKQDEKTKKAYYKPETHGQTGYTPMLIETAETHYAPDYKEMLNWSNNIVHTKHPLVKKWNNHYNHATLPKNMEKNLITFHNKVEQLQKRVLRLIATGIGADETYFENMLAVPSTLTRAIHYPKMKTAPKNSLWAAPHADINLITALPRATEKGLQVQTTDGWVDAEPPKGHAIINTGLMLEHLTNGTIPSGWHQVVASHTNKERYSIVQFLHPSPWTILTPIPSTTINTPTKYSAIQAGDKLEETLYNINLT